MPGDAAFRIGSSQLPWPSHPLPLYMGQIFPTLCKLWVLIQEIESVYDLTNSIPLVDRVSLAFAESRYQMLLSWADTILPQMLLKQHNSTLVLFFQYVLSAVRNAHLTSSQWLISLRHPLALPAVYRCTSSAASSVIHLC
jgi:hypothetical protein